MDRMVRRHSIILIEKDGLVRNLFRVDENLQKTLGKGSGVRKSRTLFGHILSGLRRSLGFMD